RNMTELGFPLADAAAMASTTPAELLRTGRGRILPGYPADLAFLDGDCRVLRTVVAGRTVYEWAGR
ncbi:MAG: amidohydrolase family protein, partial [Eubacteriales bacterium]|nr:amidohydrolase family protein [Eubacteriales bacterium]